MISGNGYGGVLITGSTAVVAGNFIGTDVKGTCLLSNGLEAPGAGVGIQVYLGINRIGTDGDGVGDAFERNIIAGISAAWTASSSAAAPRKPLWPATTSAPTCAGPTRWGTEPASWSREVPETASAPMATMSVASPRGMSSQETATASKSTRVPTTTSSAGNFIGTDFIGTQPLGNQHDGIIISGDHNRIGTDSDGVNDADERNVISGNENGDGIHIQSAGTPSTPASYNVVAGNFIGTDINGARVPLMGNGTGIADLGGVSGVTIGGTAQGSCNVIAYNATGVSVATSYYGLASIPVGVSILGNSIHDNLGPGSYPTDPTLTWRRPCSRPFPAAPRP